METNRTVRAEVLALLRGERSSRIPCFSGLISVTAFGLDNLGQHYSETHNDSAKMAAAAASSYRLCGLESAVVPLDLCVEAEALGCGVDFRAGSIRPEFPSVVQSRADSVISLDLQLPPDFEQRGRLPIVADAIRLLKEQVGQEVVVGAWVPGPFTLLSLLVNPTTLYAEIAHPPQHLSRTLDTLTEALMRVAALYQRAGADFITVHEMGGSPGVIGPTRFRALVLPPLQRLLLSIPSPTVLSVCGRTTAAVALLAEAGAGALSVDQLNDVAQSRATLGAGPLLFGNIDPVEVLANGDESGVRAAVARAIESGVDAVWPGCDLWPVLPAENLRAMADEAHRHLRAPVGLRRTL